MKMDMGEQNVQLLGGGEEEVEETSLLLRKSRTVSGSRIIEIDHSSGSSETNGSVVIDFGAQNQDSHIEIEDKFKELHGFLNNELENVEHKSEKLKLGEFVVNEPQVKHWELKSDNLELGEVLVSEQDIKDGVQKLENFEVGETLANALEVKDGEHKLKNLVFYDRVEVIEFSTEDSREKKIERNNGHDKPHISSHDFIHLNHSTEKHTNFDGTVDNIISSSSPNEPSQSLFQKEYSTSKEIETHVIPVVKFSSDDSREKKIERNNGHDKPHISSHDFIHLNHSTKEHTKSEGTVDSIISSSAPNLEPSQSLFQEEHSSSNVTETHVISVTEFSSEDSREKKTERNNGHDESHISSHDFTHLNHSTEKHTKSEGTVNSIISSSTPNLEPSQSLSQEESSSSKEIESVDDDVINEEDELEVTEFDVEKVIQKQNTHDLYCPNCKSCITRRVILRKRKRRGRVTEEEIKRNKVEEVAADSISSTVGVDEHDKEPTVDEGDEQTTEPEKDVFRCLSCFSFFIPSGHGFKLFRKVEDRSREENIQDERSVRKNWFISMFSSKKHVSVAEQGSNVHTDNFGDQSLQPLLVQEAHMDRVESAIDEKIINATQDTYHKVSENIGSNIHISSVGGESSFNFVDQTVQPSLVQEETHATAHTSTGGHLGSSWWKSTHENNERAEHTWNGSAQYIYNKTTENIGSNIHVSSVGGESSFNFVDQTVQPSLVQEETHATAHSSTGGHLGSSWWKSTHENNERAEHTWNGGAEYIYNKTTENIDKEHGHLLNQSESVSNESDLEGKFSISVAIPHEEQQVGAYIMTESVENRNATFDSSETGHLHSTEVSQQIITKSKYEVHTGETLRFDNTSAVTGVSVSQGGKDTIITIDARPAELSSQSPQSTILPTESSSVLLSVGSQVPTRDREISYQETKEIEVVKSIVYGGLAESITSLGVVSSAIGGGASTLNTIAIAMASLFGGLIIIFHNLWDLRSDCEVPQVSDQNSNQVIQEKGRYKELLGRRENFILHAIVAIISYIIFGLVPPIVFGFSFRASDDKEFKIMAMAGASFLCILILAIGKAYVCRPPKPYLKTISTFLIMGFMVSGVSYGAGVLVERLLEQLGLFQPSSVSGLLLPEMTQGALASS